MPLFDLFWAMLWFFLFFIWIWLLIKVFADIFRADMSGIAKALWIIFVIVFPLLGVLVYLIAQGANMAQRDVARAQELEQAQRAYIQNVAGGSAGTADEIEKLVTLKDQGAITSEEFQSQKTKLLAS